MHFRKIAPIVVFAAILILPVVAIAVVPPGPTPGTPTAPLTTLEQFLGLICLAGNILFTVILILSVVILLVAAFMFLTAGGDDEKTGTARKWLTSAIIGIVVALLAKGIVLAIGTTLGATAPQCS